MTTERQVAPRAAATFLSEVHNAGLRLVATTRQHALFLVLLTGGLALRIVTQLAYRPAILYIDSYRYLYNAFELDPARNQPLGYAIFIRPLLQFFDTLAVIAAVNHILGLAMAVMIYAVLLRCGAWRWLAALASAPVLLDAYQLQIEQMIMSDALFQAMIVAGFALLVWWRRPGPAVAGAAGLLLGLAVLVRLVGQPLIIPAVILLLLAGGRWWYRLVSSLVCAVMFAVPLLLYADWHDDAGGGFRLNYQTSYVLYARVAPIVNCDKLDIPAYQRPLCPDRPKETRPNEDWYFWHGPVREYEAPPGRDKQQVISDFFQSVLAQQPGRVVRAVGWDYLKSFAWEKERFGNDLPVSRWRFQTYFPMYDRPDLVRDAVAVYGGYGPALNKPLAEFLRGYQLSAGYVPGPVLLAAIMVALVAALGRGRARSSKLRAASLMWTMAGIGIVLTADLYEFSWRYQLPALVLLPVAGALGLTALFRKRPPRPRGRPPEPATPVAARTLHPPSSALAADVADTAGSGRRPQTTARTQSASAGTARGDPSRPRDG